MMKMWQKWLSIEFITKNWYKLETDARLISCIFGENSVFLSVLIIHLGPYFSLNKYDIEYKSKNMCAIHNFMGITCVKNWQNYKIEKNVRLKNSINLTRAKRAQEKCYNLWNMWWMFLKHCYVGIRSCIQRKKQIC